MSHKHTNSIFTVKTLTYTAIMAALGVALAVLSIELMPLAPTQISIDLSHLGTFLVAIPGGPIIGAIAGAIVGIYPGFAFGYSHGTMGLLGLVGLPLGKAMTGAFSGLTQRYLKRPLLSVIIGYVPECIFTLWLFAMVCPFVLGWDPYFSLIILGIPILMKAWIEILAMAFLMESVFLSHGIVHMLRTVFPSWDYTPLSEL
jgi:riboflavin transporter FmnP